MAPPLRWLLLLLLLAAAATTTVTQAQAQAQTLTSRTDLAALYSLRASLGLRARDWPLKTDPCTRWVGVTCTGGRVVGVTVAGLRRTRLAANATTPPGVALDGLRNLTALARFNASGFAIPGEIPTWFGFGLPAPLAVLDLTSASVNGTLPPDLGASGNLTAVYLSGNRLTGDVPAPLLSVVGLQVLDLSRNNLTGPLPNVSVSVGDAGDVANASGSVFNVSGNSLYGVAADAIAALRRRFQVVDVSSNYLDGGAWNGSTNTTTVLATTNCFYYGVPGQRSRADCEEFYSKQGVKLVDAPSPSPSPVPSPQAPPSQEKKKKKKKKRISKNVLIGVLVAAGALMAMFFIALLLCFAKRRRSRGGATGGVEPNEEGTRSISARRRDSSVNPVVLSPSAVSPSANDDGPKDLSAVLGEFTTYEQLVLATGGFGDDKLIKHGHSGDIYHGVLENGSHVIVKKVGGIAKGVNNRHASELDFYTRYSHERIVPLLAHLSNDDDEEFMAYKYMPKMDLTNALHKKPVDAADGLPSLDWITRLKIATGVAEAMCFLHDECSPPLVHRDIQSSSVLLDDKYEVRLGSMSDICIQQSGGSQNVFTRILRSSKSLDKHTSGPPATCSYDVFCFGKVLLELVTGNIGMSGSNNEEWLSNTLNQISNGDRAASIAGIVDPLLLVDEDHLEEVWAVAIIAKTCLSAKPSRRPSARYVLRALESPLRVVRQGSSSRSSSARQQQLRSSSSRSSWQSVFQGNHRVQSLDASASAMALDRRHSLRSQGSGGGEASFSFKRAVLTDAAPEPAAAAVLDEDAVVV